MMIIIESNYNSAYDSFSIYAINVPIVCVEHLLYINNFKHTTLRNFEIISKFDVIESLEICTEVDNDIS
jgi:hypothetical protein